MHLQTSASPPRVLVVDDHVDTVDVTAMVLQTVGATVDKAYSGAMAIELARATAPDLILLDLVMPDMDGYQVARELQAGPLPQTTQLVAVSGLDQPIDKVHCAEAGFDLHLTKPVGFEMLAELVAGRRKSQDLSVRFSELERRHKAGLRSLLAARVDMAVTLLKVGRSSANEQIKQRSLEKALRVRHQVASYLLRARWASDSMSPLEFIVEDALDRALPLFGQELGAVNVNQRRFLPVQLPPLDPVHVRPVL
jgi:CheY-like chemotaxis protein